MPLDTADLIVDAAAFIASIVAVVCWLDIRSMVKRSFVDHHRISEQAREMLAEHQREVSAELARNDDFDLTHKEEVYAGR